jgi:hypothetical protein
VIYVYTSMCILVHIRLMMMKVCVHCCCVL